MDWKTGTWCAILGCFGGVLDSMTVLKTLIGISHNLIYTFVAAPVLLSLCFVIVKRGMKLASEKQDAGTAALLVYIFAIVILISGICCFLVNDKILDMGPALKTPMYGFVGVGISFCCVFLYVDLINLIADCYDVGKIRKRQSVLILIVSSTVIGLLFGLSFGGLDVEDHLNPGSTSLNEDRWLSVGSAALVGALSGVGVCYYQGGLMETISDSIQRRGEEGDETFQESAQGYLERVKGALLQPYVQLLNDSKFLATEGLAEATLIQNTSIRTSVMSIIHSSVSWVQVAADVACGEVLLQHDQIQASLEAARERYVNEMSGITIPDGVFSECLFSAEPKVLARDIL